jgi:hypothetical protein
MIIGAMIPYRAQAAQDQGITSQNVTSVQRDALNWIREHVPQDAVVVVNSYLYPDLHSDNENYYKACYYRNELFTTDPNEIGKLQNNWKNIDYLVLDDQMQQEIRILSSQMSIFERALHSAEPPQVFRGSGGSVSIYHIVHEKVVRNRGQEIHC